jgi:hypothetical protein
MSVNIHTTLFLILDCLVENFTTTLKDAVLSDVSCRILAYFHHQCCWMALELSRIGREVGLGVFVFLSRRDPHWPDYDPPPFHVQLPGWKEVLSAFSKYL